MLRDQRQRDARDAARAIAPMKPAADAIVIDSTGMSIEAVVDRMAADIEDQPRGHGERRTEPPEILVSEPAPVPAADRSAARPAPGLEAGPGPSGDPRDRSLARSRSGTGSSST